VRTLLRWTAFALAAAALASVGAGAGLAAPKPRVTFVGDSVAASLLFVPSAVKALGRGLNLRLDVKVCRRLVAPSCTYQGETPSTALEVVKASGRSLGDVLVVDVGYNDAASTYARHLDQVMRAARSAGVKAVVWLTLREDRQTYASINRVIRARAKRWKELRVADWNARSAGKPWFAGDGLHLTSAGAHGLAALVRSHVFAALKS
jgi:hypothetical protein